MSGITDLKTPASESDSNGLPKTASKSDRNGPPKTAPESDSNGLPKKASESGSNGLVKTASESDSNGPPRTASKSGSNHVTKVAYDLEKTQYLPVCRGCGTQYLQMEPSCPICEDPRNFSGSDGPDFTTLAAMRKAGYKNTFVPYPPGSDLQSALFISIVTTPRFGFGQRAILIRTESGKNILWDCVTLLDDDTISLINKLGGIHAMVISSPRCYSTHVDWAEVFDCRYYLSPIDCEWRTRDNKRLLANNIPPHGCDIVLGGIDTGVRIIPLGGPYDGSLVLLWNKHLFISDTIVTTPAGVSLSKANAGRRGHRNRWNGSINSFAFMKSIFNLQPLDSKTIMSMLEILHPYSPFTSTHGWTLGTDMESENMWDVLLVSARMQLGSVQGREHKQGREETRGEGYKPEEKDIPEGKDKPEGKNEQDGKDKQDGKDDPAWRAYLK